MMYFQEKKLTVYLCGFTKYRYCMFCDHIINQGNITEFCKVVESCKGEKVSAASDCS